MNPICLAFAMLAPLASPPADPAHVALVSRLADDEYKTRQSAHAALEEQGYAALPALRAGLSHADLEVRSRCGQLIDTAIDREVARYGVMPWLDAAWTEGGVSGIVHKDRYAWAGRYLGMVSEPNEVPYTNYRSATKLMLKDWLKAGVPRASIDAEMKRMKASDKLLAEKNPGWLGERVPAPADAP